MADILKSLPYILKNEGVYTNDPRDPGGPTRYGITLATLSDWRGHRCSADDVKQLPLEEASKIYKAHYWDICHLDDVLSQGVATAIFDVATNRGPGIARQYTSETCTSLGKPNVNACTPHEFVYAFERRVEAGYYNIVKYKPSMKVYIKGWINRAKRLLSLA